MLCGMCSYDGASVCVKKERGPSRLMSPATVSHKNLKGRYALSSSVNISISWNFVGVFSHIPFALVVLSVCKFHHICVGVLQIYLISKATVTIVTTKYSQIPTTQRNLEICVQDRFAFSPNGSPLYPLNQKIMQFELRCCRMKSAPSPKNLRNKIIFSLSFNINN